MRSQSARRPLAPFARDLDPTWMGVQRFRLCAAVPQSCLRRFGHLSIYAFPRQRPAPLLSTARLTTAVAAAVTGDMDQGQASTTPEQDAKKLLRQQLKKNLKALTSESMQRQSKHRVSLPGHKCSFTRALSSCMLPGAAGRQIAQHVLQSRFFHDASSVGLYVTCERLREVDTAALLGEALQHGGWQG